MSATDSLQFLADAPPRLLRLLQVLAAAESLTDEVALKLLEDQGVSKNFAAAFLELLHCADYVVPCNSEWNFAADVRVALRQSARENNVPLKDVHKLLLKIGSNGDRATAGVLIPAYLFTNAGVAYHMGELGRTKDALLQYARAAETSDKGELWLASLLAEEQQRVGTLAENVIEPTFLRALSAYRDNDKDRAYRDLLIVARSGKTSTLVAWAMQLTGEIEMQRGDLDAAIEHLNQAVNLFDTLKSRNKLIWALASRAAVLHLLKQSPEALKDLERAISMCRGGDWRALLLCRVAVIEHGCHHFDKALIALCEAERCTRSENVLMIVLIQRASLKRERNDLVGALRDLDRAVAISPEYSRSVALNTRASVLWDLGKLQEAREELNHALQIARPENLAIILNTRSCVRRDQGDFAGALSDTKKIHSLPPKLRRSIEMARIDRRSRKLQKSINKLSKFSKEGTDLDKFWFKYFSSSAKASIKFRAPYRAAELMKLALTYAHSDDERVKCLCWIGIAYEHTLNDKALAVEPLLQAIRLMPDNSTALATLGRVLDSLGRPFEEVKPYFLQAIDADPRNEWARSWYALALSREGQHDDAIRYAKGALGEPPHCMRLFNLALVLDASPDPNIRREALLFAQQAKEVAPLGFDEPVTFLERHRADEKG